MATQKTYVYVDKIDVSKIFDSKYKGKVQDMARKLASKWVDKSKELTTRGDKKQNGFMLGGTISKLLKGDKGGKTLLAAEMSMHMSTWPKKSMFGFPSGKAAVEVLNEAKIERDIEDLLDSLIESLVLKKANKEFEKRAKDLAKSK